jgi:hypothetical protein
MCGLADASIILAMIRPISSASKVLLVADRRAGSSDSAAVPVRRYRLARIRFDGRQTASESRFEHLKRVYD